MTTFDSLEDKYMNFHYIWEKFCPNLHEQVIWKWIWSNWKWQLDYSFPNAKLYISRLWRPISHICWHLWSHTKRMCDDKSYLYCGEFVKTQSFTDLVPLDIGNPGKVESRLICGFILGLVTWAALNETTAHKTTVSKIKFISTPEKSVVTAT